MEKGPGEEVIYNLRMMRASFSVRTDSRRLGGRPGVEVVPFRDRKGGRKKFSVKQEKTPQKNAVEGGMGHRKGECLKKKEKGRETLQERGKKVLLE